MKKRLIMFLWVVGFMVTASLLAEPIRDLFPKSDNSQHNQHDSNEQHQSGESDAKKFKVGESVLGGKTRNIGTMENAVSLCQLADDGKDFRGKRTGTAGVIGNACQLRGADQGIQLALDQGLRNLLSEPVILSEGKLCQSDKFKPFLQTEFAEAEYKKILEKKLVQQCIKAICEEKGLGDTCNLNPGSVSVGPGLIDQVVSIYGSKISCKKSNILQMMR